MLVKPVRLGFFSRLTGKCATPEPYDAGCWTYDAGRILVDPARAPELSALQGAIRLEGKGLPVRVLLFRGTEGRFHALSNACSHGKRRLDPLPGTELVQCCSLGRSTYDYGGHVVDGPAKEAVRVFPVAATNGRIVVTVESTN